MKRLLMLLLISAFVTYLFPISEVELTEVLLSEDYYLELERFLKESPSTRAAIAMVNGLRFVETLQPHFRRRFRENFELVQLEELSEPFSASLDVIRVSTLESMVTGLNLVEEKTASRLMDAVALRLYYVDWTRTGVPASARKALELAESLRTDSPTSFLPYLVTLDYHSKSAFRVPEEFLRMRELALENLEADGIIRILVEGLYRLGKFDLVIEDFGRLEIHDHQSAFYTGISYFRTGNAEEAEILLASIDDLRAISPHQLSQLFFVRGQIAEDRNDIPEALRLYKKSTDHDSTNRQALKRLGLVYLKSDETDKELMARFYLELSKLEQFDPEVAEALKELRTRAVLKVVITQIAPIAVAVIVTLIVVEYVHKRRKRMEEKRALEGDGNG